jgi:uncharacterized protein YfaT (DUF1175 family)
MLYQAGGAANHGCSRLSGGILGICLLSLALTAATTTVDSTLDTDRDRQAFTNWFTWLAEAQYFQPESARPKEIEDCAALIRYAYREALRKHDSAWANASGLPEFPNFPDVEKYTFPHTPTGPNLFLTATGRFQQFADAQTLWRNNTHSIGRNLNRAQPGDLLFFRRGTNFHSMIYLGESKIKPDGHKYLLYHTGSGEMRRPTVEELMRFPQPEWRPEPTNPAFLGISRWNILSNCGAANPGCSRLSGGLFEAGAK